MSEKKHKAVAKPITESTPPPKYTLMPISKTRINCCNASRAKKNNKKD